MIAEGTRGSSLKALDVKDESSQSASGSYAVHGCYCAHTCATQQSGSGAGMCQNHGRVSISSHSTPRHSWLRGRFEDNNVRHEKNVQQC